MAYCHECGSEVAENDIFCPYCGITIKPLQITEPFAEAASGAVVPVAPQPDFIEQTESPLVSAPDFPQQSADFPTAAKAEKIPSTAETHDDIQSGNAAASSKPAEKIEILKPLGEISNFDKAEESNALSAAANSERQDAHVETETSTGEEIISNIGEKEKIAETQNESALMNYAEAEVKEGKEFLETEIKSDAEIISDAENAQAAEEADFTATIPYIPKNMENIAPQELGAASEIEKLKTDFQPPPNQEPQPIAKPEIHLEEAEKFPPSKFDSVRIFENKESSEPKREAVSAAQVSESVSPPQDKSETEKSEKAGRSFTTPNIGGTETDGKKSAKLKPLDEGTILNNRYEIIRKIGGGGMGAVYLASDKNLGGVLRAVKEMVQSYIEGEQQEKAVNDFKRESLLLTSLEHQSIPTIYDYFYDEKEARFYLVMKYISGGDLASRLRSAPEGRIEEASVTEWAIQIADVLDYLHNRQPPIVYRDLKPANIMIDGNTGRCMLIDFGIARWVNKEEKGVTAVGTMGYAPPELFSGNVEPRSDIYSLGSTIFHLLTGADPQNNPLLIFDFQKHPRPRQINPQLSDQMERILMRAVEYSADKRFSSAAELRSALEEHLQKLKANQVTFGVKDAPVAVSLSDQPVFCGFCGQKIVATDMFCAFCGAKQPLAQQGVQQPRYSHAPRTAQLLIIGTNELETPAFRIEKDENLVGRRDPMSNIFPEVDLSKYDPQTKISRRHARIWREGNSFMVEDLGSSNGTIVLSVVSKTFKLQPRQPYALNNGDKLRLGDTTLHFVLN